MFWLFPFLFFTLIQITKIKRSNAFGQAARGLKFICLCLSALERSFIHFFFRIQFYYFFFGVSISTWSIHHGFPTWDSICIRAQMTRWGRKNSSFIRREFRMWKRFSEINQICFLQKDFFCFVLWSFHYFNESQNTTLYTWLYRQPYKCKKNIHDLKWQ